MESALSKRDLSSTGEMSLQRFSAEILHLERKMIALTHEHASPESSTHQLKIVIVTC